MTADNVVLTRPGRLGNLARPAAVHRRVYVCTCDPTEVHRAILLARAAAERDTGPLRVGSILHRAYPPGPATATLQVLRADLAAGRVLGLDVADVDVALTSLADAPTRWLIIATARTLTTQCGHLARWS